MSAADWPVKPQFPVFAGIGPRHRKAVADLAWALAECDRLREENARLRALIIAPPPPEPQEESTDADH